MAYSPDEVARLHELWPTASRTELLAAFPERNWPGLNNKAFRLGIARLRPELYRADEDALLRQHYPATGTRLVRNLLERPISSLHQRAKELGLRYEPLPVAKPTKLAVGRPKLPDKPPKPAPAKNTTKHRPSPEHGLKPLVIKGNSTRGASGSTPNLNANKAAKARKEQGQQQKPKPFVTADQVRALSASHPARLAYTRAAFHGPAAATAAFHEAMSQHKQAA